MKEGAVGVVSVAAHIAGKKIQEMMAAFISADIDKATTIDQSLQALYEGLFMSTNPVPVKHAMRLLGFPMGPPRLPLVDLTEQEAKELELVLDTYLKIS